MPSDSVRVTVDVATVLRVFIDHMGEQQYGYQLMRDTGFPSGKLYPILARLLEAEWLEKNRETIDPRVEKRPVRHWYRLTEKGAVTARQALAEIHERLSPAPHLGTVQPKWNLT